MVLLLLFAALASLYYYKEHRRYYQEQKVRHKITFSECRHLKKMLPSAAECHMQPVVIDKEIQTVYREIFYALLVALALILPFGYFLAYLSIRPMRESVAAMDGFINGIVHDINTPLSVIRMNAQGIGRVVSDNKLKAKASRLLQGVEQIESLEEQLLFSVKVGRYELQKEHFDIALLLQEREHYWGSLRSSVKVGVKASKFNVHADKAALLRMIDNIVLNAIKYSSAGQKVKIVLESGLLSVHDRGAGIKHPKKVFNKYYREALHSKGIGLGLYIVAKVAILHGLNIDIDSELGSGTTFSIDLSPVSDIYFSTS